MFTQKSTTTAKDIELALGRAGRLTYLIPSTRPFVSNLWAAWAGAQAAGRGHRREAPPGQFATRRCWASAGWIQTLMRPPVSMSMAESGLVPWT